MGDDSVRNAVVGQVVGNVVQAGSATLVPPEARPIAVAGLPPPAVFVGREADLARLTAALRPGAPDASLVWSIGGLPGVGKTALAVTAAHHAVAAGWFPGGVVMTDLRGYDDPRRRVAASTALARLLGALGVASDHVPLEPEDRARLWRSVLAGRERMLVLADNVSDVAQVVPLLPGSTRHQVLITSRHRLAGLDHTRLLDLDVLDPRDAVRMLAEVLRMGDPDDDRTTDLAACERVARLCGGLPLAVRVAAALLVAEPERPVTDVADALADGRNRLRTLDHDGSLAVRATFDLSYAHLPSEQARLLRLTALDPGPDVATDTVASIAGTDRTTALRAIRGLRAAHLLQPAQRPDRWRMHDLVKLYAAEKAAGPERDAAITRMLDHYLTLVRGTLDRIGDLRMEPDVLFAVDTERANLVAVTDLAHVEDCPEHLVGLALGLSDYLGLHRLWPERIAVQGTALSAARTRGDVAVEAELLVKLGYAHLQLGRTDLAKTGFRGALRLFRRSGDRVGFGNALNRLGEVYRATGRSRWGMACHRWAHDLFRSAGATQWRISALANLAFAHREQRDLDEAITLQRQALALSRELGLPLLEGRGLNQSGITCRGMARFDEAIEHHLGAVGLFRGLGARQDLAAALRELATTYRAMSRDDDASRCELEAERVTDPA